MNARPTTFLDSLLAHEPGADAAITFLPSASD